MIDREEMTDVAFELLKLLFFVVTFFLIVNGIGKITIEEIDSVSIDKKASFYNTLFIFSATTWIDYLSLMKDSIREGYVYSGKYTTNPRVSIIGTYMGFVATFISLMCVFFKEEPEFFAWGAFIYWVSSFFLGLKAFVISDMILQIKKDWSRSFEIYEKLINIILFVALAILLLKVFGGREAGGAMPLLFLLLTNKELIPCIVISALILGGLISSLCIYLSGKKKEHMYSTIVTGKKKEHKTCFDEQSYLDIQNETDGKMPYDDLEFNWIIEKEKEKNHEITKKHKIEKKRKKRI